MLFKKDKARTLEIKALFEINHKHPSF